MTNRTCRPSPSRTETSTPSGGCDDRGDAGVVQERGHQPVVERVLLHDGADVPAVPGAVGVAGDRGEALHRPGPVAGDDLRPVRGGLRPVRVAGWR